MPDLTGLPWRKQSPRQYFGPDQMAGRVGGLILHTLEPEFVGVARIRLKNRAFDSHVS
jgi:hypothetical protein